MAGNQRNFDLALQAAEAGLRGGERFVDADSMPEAVSPCAAVPCTTKVYERGYLAKTVDYEEQAFESNEWWQERAQPYDAAGATVIGGLGLADAEPMFYIEEVEEVPDALSIPPTGPPPSRVFYRIVARGKGGTDNANVVLHSTYVRRFN
jgi:type IV pilus assembly protein PilX